MKKLLLGSALLVAGATFALTTEAKSSEKLANHQWQNISDTTPQDTSDTTHKPDSLFLANFLAKN